MSARVTHAWRDDCFAAGEAHTAAQWRAQLRYAEAMGWLTPVQANAAEEEIRAGGRVWSAAIAAEEDAERERAAEAAIWTAVYSGAARAADCWGGAVMVAENEAGIDRMEALGRRMAAGHERHCIAPQGGPSAKAFLIAAALAAAVWPALLWLIVHAARAI